MLRNMKMLFFTKYVLKSNSISTVTFSCSWCSLILVVVTSGGSVGVWLKLS